MADALAEVTSWVFADLADPREFLAKMNPTGPELHSPGAGTDVQRKKERRVAATGLGATAVATAGGLHAVSATMKENKARVAAAKKTKVFGRPKQSRLVRLAGKAHVSPVRAAELAGAGWLGLHGVELTGDALAARAQARALKQNKKPARTTIAARAPGHFRRVEEIEKLSLDPLRRSGWILPKAGIGLRETARGVFRPGQTASDVKAGHREMHMAAQRAETAKPMPRMPGESRAQRNVRQRKLMRQAGRAAKVADTREAAEAIAAHPQVQQGAHALVQGLRQASEAPARKPLIRHPATLVGGGAVAGAGGLAYSQNRRRPIAARAPQQVVDQLTFSGQISKLDTDKRLAFGWASISKVNGEPYVDRQGDWIPIETTETAAYDYVRNCRVGGDMHKRAGITKEWGPHKVADLVESFVATPEKLAKMGIPPGVVPEGWWCGFKVHDEETWDAIKTGKRTGFSVHGTGIRKDVTL